MDRGGPTPARVDRLQFGDQRATPPPTSNTRGDGRACNPTAPPSATDARGGRRGLTATELARHAFALHKQCVAAGQWARVSVEQRADGQHITFASRPMAAAPAAACAAANVARRRRPNQRRKEKKQLWLRSRQQQQLQASVAAAVGSGSYAQAAARAAFQRDIATAAAPTVTAAASAAVAAPSCSPASSSSPMLTRARKRRKQSSPGAASAIVQLDGAEQTPPSSPPEPFSLSSPRLAAYLSPDRPLVPASLAVPAVPLVSDGSPAHIVQPVPDEPISPVLPPPPRPLPSSYLPSFWNEVICRSCLRNSHTLRFVQCRRCFAAGIPSEPSYPNLVK
jgi:DNA segregation ATPase FtsK/SpoIIIE, S-DNA-T family